MSSGLRHISRATLTWDNPDGERAAKQIVLVAVELNKFNKSLHELVAMADRWCYHQALGRIDSRASRVFIPRRRDEDGIRTFSRDVQR